MPRPRLPRIGRWRWWRPAAWLRGLLGPTGEVARQSLVALFLNSSTSLVAGAVLASITDTFEALPGLLVLVPAAIGLRGNVFTAFGNRLSTAIHAGTFRFSLRPATLLGQNTSASLILTLSMSLILAVVAKAVAVGLGVLHTISVLDLALISIVGGLLASIAVLGATLLLAGGSVRYGWDLDNVTAPLVSTLGDVLTLPALWAATFLLDLRQLATILSVLLVVAAAASLVVGLRSKRDVLRRVVRESAPILVVAVCLSTMAGIALEKRQATFQDVPAVLILVPAFISSAGALGGILASRLSTKLHLGLIGPDPVPEREARRDGLQLAILALPVFVFNAAAAHGVAAVLGRESPGLLVMVAASMLGGLAAVAFVVAVAYYGTVASVRVGVDPDTYGVPVVTSSVDFVGAVALIVAFVALGVA